ncbi:MAG: sulfatase-like hydrolase/transferase [Luteitalea sp.]|nr:sulfatase-like hydrolase/transferase [Luteitalea sp.]
MTASINRRQAVRMLGMAAVGAPAILRGQRRVGDKPNLLFVETDQQRADTMAVYGKRRFRVPVMNDLASRSVVFEHCYDSQPVCTPARSTVMTGLWPHQSGCTQNNIPLRPDTRTVPELLADSAYRTGHMGKWHLGDEVFAQHGFQEWVSIEDQYSEFFSAGRDPRARSSYSDFLEQLGYAPTSATGHFSRTFAARRPLEQCKAAYLAGEASKFIVKHRGEPWMLYVSFLEPHQPFFGPFDDLHDDADAPLPTNYPGLPVEREPEVYETWRQSSRKGIEAQLGWKPRTPSAAMDEAAWREALKALNRQYAGLCSQVDHALGQILWAVETSGQADNTIIAFTSDHGEMAGAHSLITKRVMYEEAIRVPMLLCVPWRQRSQIAVAQPVSHIDLVPTLLELMQRKVPEALLGESWVGMLDRRERREDHVFVEWTPLPQTDGPRARTVISPDGWKLAFYDEDNCLLFHRDRDPLEMSNLYYRSEYAGTVRRLHTQIARWQERSGDRLPLPDPV